MQPEPGMRVCDPACGTGGLLLAAHDYIAGHAMLDPDQRKSSAPRSPPAGARRFGLHPMPRSKVHLEPHEDAVDEKLDRLASDLDRARAAVDDTEVRLANLNEWSVEVAAVLSSVLRRHPLGSGYVARTFGRGGRLARFRGVPLGQVLGREALGRGALSVLAADARRTAHHHPTMTRMT